MIKTYEEFKGWREVSDFAKSLEIGDFFKYTNKGAYDMNISIAEVVNKYKDESLTIVHQLYYNDFYKEWRETNDKSYCTPNMDLISACASPITKDDMKEIDQLLLNNKYNL